MGTASGPMESNAKNASIRPVTIRLTGPHGTSRIKVENTGTINDLYAAAESSLGSEAGSLNLSTDLPGQKLLSRGSQSLKQAGLMNGDQLYIQTGVKEYMAVPSAMETDSPAAAPTSSKRPATANNKTFRIDDIPDEVEEGPVTAKYTPTLAIVEDHRMHHERGDNSHHPFIDVGLEHFDYSAHQGFNTFKKASGHTRMHIRDAPKSVVLTGQKHRHCDNVQMSDNNALRNFTTSWQNGGMADQCMAYMFGEYQPYEAYEHGLKATVYALYEPPQTSAIEGFTVLPDPTNEHAERVARMLGLSRVGWVFTTGARNKTEEDEPLNRLSSSEIALAAHYQHQTQISHNGKLTPISRFVSLMIQPDVSAAMVGEVNVEPLAFQVTDQAIALHRDNILEQPHKLDFCAVRKAASADDFVAPVIYQGNDVTEIDIDFLQIPLTVTVNDDSSSNGCMFKRNSFPTRLFLKRDPTVNELKGEFRRYGSLPPHQMLADFNLLIFLASVESLKDDMQAICDCVRTEGELRPETMQKLQQYMPSSSDMASSFGAPAPAAASAGPAAGGSNHSEAIDQVVAMGFSREQAAFAVDAAAGDVGAALNMLM